MIKFKKIDFDVTPYLIKLPEVLSRHPEIIAAYLFGSYASGRITPLSDVDIGYIIIPDFPAKDLLDKELTIDGEISHALRTDEVECFLLNNKPVSFQYQVISTGKKIYCSNEELRASYESLIISKYLDQKYYQDLNTELFLENLKNTYDKT